MSIITLDQLPNLKFYKLTNKDEQHYGMKYKDVADSLNISVKTVEMHVGKALKRIKIAFDKYLK